MSLRYEQAEDDVGSQPDAFGVHFHGFMRYAGGEGRWESPAPDRAQHRNGCAQISKLSNVKRFQAKQIADKPHFYSWELQATAGHARPRATAVWVNPAAHGINPGNVFIYQPAASAYAHFSTSLNSPEVLMNWAGRRRRALCRFRYKAVFTGIPKPHQQAPQYCLQRVAAKFFSSGQRAALRLQAGLQCAAVVAEHLSKVARLGAPVRR